MSNVLFIEFGLHSVAKVDESGEGGDVCVVFLLVETSQQSMCFRIIICVSFYVFCKIKLPQKGRNGGMVGREIGVYRKFEIVNSEFLFIILLFYIRNCGFYLKKNYGSGHFTSPPCTST